MKEAIIKRAPSNLIFDVLMALLLGFPGLIILTIVESTWMLIIGMIYLLTWAGITSFSFISLYKPIMLVSQKGISVNGNDYNWNEVESFKTITEIREQYSRETSVYQKKTENFLIIDLKNSEGLKLFVDNLNYTPQHIIDIMAEFKS